MLSSKRATLAPLLTALVLASTAAGCRRTESRPPDVLLITIDTLRPDHLGCYGHRRPTSPHLDKAARDGVLFEDVVAQAPWTLPSVASLLTSRQPQELGTIHMHSALPPDAPHSAHEEETGEHGAGV